MVIILSKFCASFKLFMLFPTGTKPLVGDCPTPSDSSPLDRNVYTVRVYRSPPQTIGDRLAIICVSLSGKLYEQVRMATRWFNNS